MIKINFYGSDIYRNGMINFCSTTNISSNAMVNSFICFIFFLFPVMLWTNPKLDKHKTKFPSELNGTRRETKKTHCEISFRLYFVCTRISSYKKFINGMWHNRVDESVNYFWPKPSPLPQCWVTQKFSFAAYRSKAVWMTKCLKYSV